MSHALAGRFFIINDTWEAHSFMPVVFRHQHSLESPEGFPKLRLLGTILNISEFVFLPCFPVMLRWRPALWELLA